MERPQAVVFDLGKVLLDFDYEKLARNLLQYCGVPLDELVQVLNQSRLLHDFETGLITSNQFFEEVKRASKFWHGYDVFEPLFADIFTPIPEIIELQGALMRSAVPTYVFSNTNEIAVKHIREEYPFFRNFTGYIFSYEHRAMKPAPRIYEVVEEKTNLRGKAILYIDDRLENIEHAGERGWQTIHHHDPKETVRVVQSVFPHLV